MKWAPEIAEAIGAFAIVFCGAGAIMATASTGAPGHVGTALAFGLAVGGMIYAAGHISGAHFNPAVSIAFALTGHFPWRRVIPYIVAQLVGATIGAVFLAIVFAERGSLGQTAISPAVTGIPGGIIIEVLITALLMFVIASVATDGRAVGRLAGSAIGGTVALNALWAGPLTGASMNPARSLGPYLIGGPVTGGPIWLYIAAPIIGACLGALLYEMVRRGDRPTKESP